MQMIVIGADTHKSTHTAGALDARTAELRGDSTAPAREAGHEELARRDRELERELRALVGAKNPRLQLGGCGTLTAAKLIAETAGAERFASDAKFARLAGVAPIPASSGRTDRHRLDRGGNRQLNCALHRIAVSQGRDDTPARDYLARKQASPGGPALPQAPARANRVEALASPLPRERIPLPLK